MKHSGPAGGWLAFVQATKLSDPPLNSYHWVISQIFLCQKREGKVALEYFLLNVSSRGG